MIAGMRLIMLSSWYQERRLSRLPLPELLKEVRDGHNKPALLYYAGLRLIEHNRCAEADALLERAVGLDPDTPRLRDAWARSLLGSGMTTAAHGELLDFTMRHPDLAVAHDLLGKFYFTQNSMQHAQEEFEKATALDPHDVEAWEYLSQAADVQNDVNRAQEAAARAVTLRPDDAKVRMLRAAVLNHAGQYASARREYARVVALDPRLAVAHRDYALCLLAYGHTAADWNLAADHARQAIALDAYDPAARLALGRALVYTHHPQDAIAPLLRAAQDAKTDPAPALALAQVYHGLGQTAEYEEWQQEYLQRQNSASQKQTLESEVSANPISRELQTKLARWLGMHGDVDGAARHYSAAMHRALDSAPVLAATARDLTAGGHADLALPLAQRAATVGNKSAMAHLALGETLFALGRETEGLNAYQTALNIEPALQSELVQRLRRRMAERRRHTGQAAPLSERR
jgi:Flp pilus assembly protein TadD